MAVAEASTSTHLGSLFVWSVWAIMLLGALVYVGKYGSNLPIVDDWDLVPSLTGDRTDTLEWLWVQHAQHRHPVPKLMVTSLLKAGRSNFRVVLYIHALILGALTFAMVQVSVRVRGRIGYADAFFPLVFLSPGLGNYLLLVSDWAFHILPTALASCLLLIIVRQESIMKLRSGALAGVCLILLALTSGGGLVYAVPLGVWLAYSAIRLRNSEEPHARRDGSALLLIAVTSLLLVPIYFIDYQWSDYGIAREPSIPAQLRVGLAFLASGFGLRTHWGLTGTVVLVLFLGSVVSLAVSARTSAGALRARALGLLFFSVAIAALVLVAATTREAGGVRRALEHHGFALPILAFIFFSSGLCARRSAATVVQIGLLVVALLAAAPNLAHGVEDGRRLRGRTEAFAGDLRSGMPPHRLIARHKRDVLNWGTHDDFFAYLQMLKRAGIGPVANMLEDPPFREVPLSPEPTQTRGIHWVGRTAHGTGKRSQLTYVLPEPMFVSGIRIRCSHSSNDHAVFRLTYRKSSDADPLQHSRHLLWSFPGLIPVGGATGSDPRSIVIWIADTLEAFTVHPHDREFELVISEIALLIPE